MEKMKFEQFTEEVVNKIREFLPRSFADARVELQTVTKNNDLKLTGLTVRSVDSNISPTIYLEQFYEQYQAGKDMGYILSTIADVRIRNEVKDAFDIEEITDFERIKDRIIPKLIGAKWNAALLEDRPHTNIADLAVTYHIYLKHDINGTASVPVNNTLMDSWKVDVDMLHALAVHNMSAMFPSSFQTMSSVLSSILADVSDQGTEQVATKMNPRNDKMYVLTNGMNGASAILDVAVMEKVLDEFDKDFYLLPSSIFEWIIVDASETEPDQLDTIIREVNSQLAVDEKLSDHCYRYTREDGLIASW